jgi:hypothetical protein
VRTTGRKANAKLGEVNVGLRVAVGITSLKDDGSIVASSVQASDDGLRDIEGTRNDGGCVRIIANGFAIEFDVN